ncbi:MAG: hypothetical protein U0X76_11705 [Bacteroidia bacterium]
MTLKTNQHEIGFIKSFIIKEKQDRLLALLQMKNSRNKIRALIAHEIYLNKMYSLPIKGELDNPRSIHKYLREKGAPTNCYIICENESFDQKEMALNDALEIIYYTDLGTIISCIPGKLAYFQSEETQSKTILEKATF